MDKLTHLKDDGVHMVEIGEKDDSKRSAIALGKIKLQRKTIDLIKNKNIEKGNVLTVAQVATINAVKSTSNIIPLCHQLVITGIEVDFTLNDDEIIATVSVSSAGKTGVEMEAITGVSVALLTIWDMVKAVEKDKHGQYPSTSITGIKVIKKEKTLL